MINPVRSRLETDLRLILEMTGFARILDSEARRAVIEETLAIPSDAPEEAQPLVLRRELLRSIATIKFDEVRDALTSTAEADCRELRERILRNLTDLPDTDACDNSRDPDMAADLAAFDPTRWSLRDAIPDESTAYLALGLVIGFMNLQDRALEREEFTIADLCPRPVRL